MYLAYWQSKLAEFIESRRYTPFKWGENDCALFVADGVEAITGIDYAAPLRGYQSQLGSKKILDACGHDTVSEYVTSLFGEAVPPLQCGRGDVVEYFSDGELALGLCVGSVFCSPGENGLNFISMAVAIRGWKICQSQQ